MLKVTYLDHSAFAFETPDALLLFDCATKTAVKLAGQMATKRLLLQQGQVVVFFSHAHGDHYNEEMFALRQWGDVEFVLSSDINSTESVHKIMPGGALQLNGIEIVAAGSTDQGVSFIVQHAGYSVFHAGDLNWWHWRDESTPKEIMRAELDFKAIADGLKGIAFDIACFPVDARLGSLYYAGADYFARAIRPKVFIPMHFWNRPDAAERFAKGADYDGVKVVTLTQSGSVYVYDK